MTTMKSTLTLALSVMSLVTGAALLSGCSQPAPAPVASAPPPAPMATTTTTATQYRR